LGVALLALGVVVVIVRVRAGWDWTRFLSLAVALVAFSLMTTLVRSFQSPFESRYMYVVCVLEVLMAVELARGVSVPRGAQLALAGLTLVAVVSNIAVLRSGGNYFRGLGAQSDATLGAVQLDRGRIAPSTPLTQLPLYPLVVVTAGHYFSAEEALGSPAYTLAQLQHATPAAQRAADAQLLTDGDVKLARVTDPSSPGGTPAAVEGAVNGVAARRGACLAFAPAATLAPGAASVLALGLNPGRVSVAAGAAPVAISVRRFAPGFTALGTLQAGGSATVSVSGDRAAQPWHLQVQTTDPVRVCTVGGT
jgi:small basic protein